MLKVFFLFKQYLWLLIFIASAFGLGRMLLYISRFPARLTSLLSYLLGITTGIGMMMVALFVLGSWDLLTPVNLYLLFGLGLLGNVINLQWLPPKNILPRISNSLVTACLKRYWFWYFLVSVLCVRYLVRPLELPMHWDEVMYHLPIAKAWAENGCLTIESQLRYPLFPYNFNLLYAASLLIADDVFTHMLHMVAGILTVVLLIPAGKRWFDLRVGIVASFLLFMSIKSQIGTANIDMGVMLLLSFGFVSLGLYHELRDVRYLYLSGFLVALAMGTKYQALFYLPVYGILVLLFERRPKILAFLAIIFLVFGGYWYIRNWAVSGDPIYPFGGRWFGYWLWNESDIHAQFSDFDHRKNLPDFWLLIGFFALPYLRVASSLTKGLYFAALGSFLVWFFASGYVRYFLPGMPLLSILSAYTLVRTFDLVGGNRLLSFFRLKVSRRIFTLSGIVLLTIGVVGAVRALEKTWGRIAVDRESREKLLSRSLTSYDILRNHAQDKQLWPIYQLGFENEIYYAPVPVVGGVFGTGRYRDIIRFANNGQALANQLNTLRAGGILINRVREPFSTLHLDLNDEYFEFVYKTDRAELYRVKE